MAKRTSGAQLLIRAAAKLPWWLCLLLAALSYFGLHRYAERGPERRTHIQSAVRGGYLYAFAAAGQYALPLVFLFGAVVSGIAGRKSNEGSGVVDEMPICPNCGGHMVKRRARKGAKTGAEFWGCASYPACRGTRDL